MNPENKKIGADLLQERLTTLRYAPSYLRHAPPVQYYSSGSHQSAGVFSTGVSYRHRVLMLDDAQWRSKSLSSLDTKSPPKPMEMHLCPHSHGVYLLSSTIGENIHFEAVTGTSNSSDSHPVHSTLMGLPNVTTEEDIQRFVDTHHELLSSVKLVCLPEITLSSARVLKALSRHFSFCIVCSEFGKEFLQNESFYQRVVNTIWESDKKQKQTMQKDFYKWLLQDGSLCSASTNFPREAIWAVSGDSKDIVIDAAMRNASTSPFSSVPLTSSRNGPLKDSPPPIESTVRPLQVQVVGLNFDSEEDKPNQQSTGAKLHSPHRYQRRESTLPDHYTHRPLFFYDSVFHAVFVGNSLLRIPWLPHALQDGMSSSSVGYRGNCFPYPGMEHARWSAPSAVPGGSTMLQFWKIQSNTRAIIHALRAFPLNTCAEDDVPQRVLSAQFGEVPGNIDDVVAGLEETSGALLALQGRLNHFLQKEINTSRENAPSDVWVPKLQEKLIRVVLCGEGETPRDRLEMPSDVEEENVDPDGSSRKRRTNDLTGTFLKWISTACGMNNPWKCLCECLFQSACGLPLPEVSSPSLLESAEKSTKKATEWPSEMTGSLGVALLAQIFTMKGLAGMEKTVKREEIDVAVFVSMTTEELQKIFKPTFGVLKRLEGLQAEVQQKADADGIMQEKDEHTAREVDTVRNYSHREKHALKRHSGHHPHKSSPTRGQHSSSRPPLLRKGNNTPLSETKMPSSSAREKAYSSEDVRII